MPSTRHEVSDPPHAKTSDSDSEEGQYTLVLGTLEDEAGYELEKLGRRLHDGDSPTAAGAEDEDEDDEQVPLAGGHAAVTSHRQRRSSAQSFELYTPDEERRVRWKLDTRLVLFVALLYMMSFLDRSNIGNAYIAGLTEDLEITDDQFDWLLTIFYIFYIAFEWMTLCYKIFSPHKYVAICVFVWGAVASLQSVTSNYPLMLLWRALLGIGEAAFVGMPFYLTFFFRREELAFRTGIFIAAAPLATTYASSLAYAIVKLGNATGIASWRLLFLLEGFPACLVAVWTWYWLPDSASDPRCLWLTERERKIATLRKRNETSRSKPTHTKSTRLGLDFSAVATTLKDPKSYLTASMFFCCNVAFSSMPVFLPTIISQMGFTKESSQGLSAPPFLFAFFVVLLTAWLSDKIHSRSSCVIFHALLASLGYLALTLEGLFDLGDVPRYLAVFPICAGFFSAVTIVITWTVNNQHTDEGKGTGMAVLNTFGQLGPLLGTRLYPDSQAPDYLMGNSICAGAMGLVAILAFGLRVLLLRENRKRKGRRDEFDFMI
ncbi:hypothetical protein D0861_02731 [Lecanosticta acicola]|uniref:Major facilitator superfamily (MFS) profile domain-containing protein n=1 Tax=Lecanosticta acicola TaxID=111012 RepID=A0AAI8YXQ2_9PEZI|nr:hypothetical protein D0861_02731 [Lecanosticta acicola]